MLGPPGPLQPAGNRWRRLDLDHLVQPVTRHMPGHAGELCRAEQQQPGLDRCRLAVLFCLQVLVQQLNRQGSFADRSGYSLD